MQSSEPQIWYRPRRYVHFDAPLSETEATKLVASASNVERHSFWPLLGYSIRERRWSKRKAKFKPKKRPIAYASHGDAHIFAYYSMILKTPYETKLRTEGLQDMVLAYRKHGSEFVRGKANYDFAADAFSEILDRGDCDVVAIDITKFFDSIPHKVLKQQWKQLLGTGELPADHYAVFRAATNFSVVQLKQARKQCGIGLRRLRTIIKLPFSGISFRKFIRDAGLITRNSKSYGIPQGLPISGLLANISMLEIDKSMRDFASEHGASYRRYSDDILLICPPGSSDQILAHLKAKLSDIGLSIQEDKTVRAEFRVSGDESVTGSTPLQYLGFTFDGQHVRVRPQTLVRFMKRMGRAVNRARNAARKGGTTRIRKRDLFMRYSHLGPQREIPPHRIPRGSFFGYANRSASVFNRPDAKRAMVAEIKRQLRRSWMHLNRRVRLAEVQLK